MDRFEDMDTFIRLVETGTGEFLTDAAVEDLGIIFIPSFIAYREIERVALDPLINDYKPTQKYAYVIYLQTLVPSYIT